MSNIKELSTSGPARELLAKNSFPALDELEKRLHSAGENRLQSRIHLSRAEVSEVSELDKSLFPKTMEIPPQATETLRLLCTWSRCELRPARAIRSHRPFIGPAIVFLKRLSWPFIRFHLKDTFESMELFHSRLVYAYASQLVEIEQLKKRLPPLP